MSKEQFIHIDEDGTKLYYADCKMTIIHREDGPAVEYANGSKAWFLNGKLHREDGPAVEYSDGDKEWYLNGKPFAVEINGELHRQDGQTFEAKDGRKQWGLNGELQTEEEFNARMNPVELTLDEIAERFGVGVEQLKIKK